MGTLEDMRHPLLFAALALCSLSFAKAATLHVASVAELQARVPPGSVVMLKRGLVYQGPVRFGSSGTADAHIRITAYGTGPAPVIRGLSDLYTDALVITGNYVDVEGLAFSDTNRAGIEIAKSASHIRVTGNDVTRVGQGVGVLGSAVTVDHNTIHDLTMVRNTPIDTTSPERIAATSHDDYGANAIVVSASHVEIAFNKIKNAKAPSFDYGMAGGAVQIFAMTPLVDISVHDNWAEGSKGFLEAGGSRGASVGGVKLYRNTSLNNGSFLDLHNGVDALSLTWTAVHAFNNTIVNEANPPNEMSNIFFKNENVEGIEIDHNIIVLNAGDSVFKQSTPGYHHDNVFFLTDSRTHLFNNWSMSLARGEIFADPLFVDRSQRNFSLQPTSPAKGMGAYSSEMIKGE